MLINELTENDFELLIEAVQAWEDKDAQGAFMGEMMGAMLGADRDKSPETRKSDVSRRLEEARKASRVKAERGVILRAKLIQIRNSLAADKVFETTADPVE